MSRPPPAPTVRTRRPLVALLACCRPGDAEPAAGDPPLANALRGLGADPTLRGNYERQQQFDREWLARLHALAPPADLAERAAARWQRARGSRRTWRGSLGVPVFIAVLLAGLFLLAWGGWTLYERRLRFPGDEALAKVLEGALPSPSLDASARAGRMRSAHGAPCGGLGDELFLATGFDAYAVPDELVNQTAAGYRVLHPPGRGPVAQVALRGGAGMTLFVFRAAELDVHIEPTGQWRPLAGDRDRWAALVQERPDGVAVAVAAPVAAEELRRQLGALGVRQP